MVGAAAAAPGGADNHREGRGGAGGLAPVAREGTARWLTRPARAASACMRPGLRPGTPHNCPETRGPITSDVRPNSHSCHTTHSLRSAEENSPPLLFFPPPVNFRGLIFLRVPWYCTLGEHCWHCGSKHEKISAASTQNWGEKSN